MDEESGRYLRYGGGSESDDDDVSNATQEYVRLSVRRRKKEPSSNNSSSLPISNLYDQHGSAGEEEDGYDGDAASGYHSDGPSTAVGPLLTTNNSFPRRPGRRDFDLCTDESGSRCQSPSMTSSVSSSGFTANLLRPHSLSNKFSAPQYKTRLRIPWKQSNSTQVEFTSDSSTHSVPPSIKRSYEQLEFSRGSGSGISVCVDPSTETPGNNNKAEEAEDRDEEDRGLMIDQKEQVNSRRVRKRMNA